MCSDFVKNKLDVVWVNEVDKSLPNREVWGMSMRKFRGWWADIVIFGNNRLWVCKDMNRTVSKGSNNCWKDTRISALKEHGQSLTCAWKV